MCLRGSLVWVCEGCIGSAAYDEVWIGIVWVWVMVVLCVTSG